MPMSSTPFRIDLSSPPIERESGNLLLRIPIRASGAAAVVLAAAAAVAICLAGDDAGDGDDANAFATVTLPLCVRPPRANDWSISGFLSDALLPLLLLLLLLALGEEATTAGGERIV